MSDLIRNALRTPDGTILESHHRHDFKTYTDANGKEYMIDGGLDYVRCSANGDEEHLCVYIDDPHEKVRESMTWGTYGVNGDQPLKRITLAEMDTDHIQACLDTQTRIYPPTRMAMENELKYRGGHGDE